MSKQSRKKLGYKEYERLLAEAHQKIEMIAKAHHELQTYFIAYVEFEGKNILFNEWMNERIKTMKAELKKKEEDKKIHEKV